MIKFLNILILIIILLQPLSAKKILLIQSYHEDYSWVKSCYKGIKKVLDDDYEIESFYMDTKRISSSKFEYMAERAFDKYKNYEPDLVILADDNALKFIGPKLAESKTPVVFLGINNNPRNYFNKMPSNITGVLERPLLKRSLGYLLRIDPSVKNVLILFDSSVTSKIMQDETFGGKNEISIGSVKSTIKRIGSFDEWKQVVLDSDKKFDVAILGLYQTLRDSKNRHVDPEDVEKWTSKNTPIPLYSFWDFTVGKEKAIGGFVNNGEMQGIEAGKIVLNILEEGKDPSSIFIKIAEKGRFVFSRSQLKKYNITLPPYIKSRATIRE